MLKMVQPLTPRPVLTGEMTSGVSTMFAGFQFSLVIFLLLVFSFAVCLGEHNKIQSSSEFIG